MLRFHASPLSPRSPSAPAPGPVGLPGAELTAPGTRCTGGEGGAAPRPAGPGRAAGCVAIGGRRCTRLSAPPPPQRSPSAAVMAARGCCPSCGSAALVEDAHYAQQQLVCAACGCVLAEGLLTTTYTEEEHLRGATGPGGGSALPGRGVGGGVVVVVTERQGGSRLYSVWCKTVGEKLVLSVLSRSEQRSSPPSSRFSQPRLRVSRCQKGLRVGGEAGCCQD